MFETETVGRVVALAAASVETDEPWAVWHVFHKIAAPWWDEAFQDAWQPIVMETIDIAVDEAVASDATMAERAAVSVGACVDAAANAGVPGDGPFDLSDLLGTLGARAPEGRDEEALERIWQVVGDALRAEIDPRRQFSLLAAFCARVRAHAAAA